MILILDYQAGNPASIKNMLKKISIEAEVSNDPFKVRDAAKIIIPGVGRFDFGARKLREMGLVESLNYKAKIERVPVLGICLGFQLMTRGSEEGSEKGLGWLDADTIMFKAENSELKIPHMGWNNVEYNKDSPLFSDFPEYARFYFVHSYYVKAKMEEDIAGKTNYIVPFTSAMNNGNIFGVQFHPEKSHKFGMQLLTNFAQL